MDETHCSYYSIIPGSTKMYHDWKEVYWWNDMKKDIAEYVAICSNFQQVKAKHQRPGGLAKTISILLWKWEAINMDFVTSLPSSFCKYKSIWLIIDRLTKSAHSLPINSPSIAEDYAKLYIREMVCLHGTHVSII